MDLSPEQQVKLQDFLSRVSDVSSTQPPEHTTDQEMTRWLQARSWSLDRAEEMYRAHLIWRQTYQPHLLLQNYQPNEILKTYWPGGLLPARSKTGQYVQVEWFGNIDMVGMLKATSKEEMIKFLVYRSEQLEVWQREEAKATGRPIQKVLMIQNLGGVSARHIRSDTLAILKAVLHPLVENYPERMGTAVFVNVPAPKILSVGWNIVKHLFDENLKSKFVFLTTSDWKAKLLELVDEAALPVYLGGKLAEPDELCSGILGVGGMVPDSLYRVNDDSFSTVVIHARQQHLVEAVVKVAGSVLSWEFSTKGFDIKFGVHYLGTEEEAEARGPKDRGEEVVASERKAGVSKEVMEGEILAEKTGVYLLVWDNGYSMLRSKTLVYKYEVTEVKE